MVFAAVRATRRGSPVQRPRIRGGTESSANAILYAGYGSTVSAEQRYAAFIGSKRQSKIAFIIDFFVPNKNSTLFHLLNALLYKVIFEFVKIASVPLTILTLVIFGVGVIVVRCHHPARLSLKVRVDLAFVVNCDVRAYDYDYKQDCEYRRQAAP